MTRPPLDSVEQISAAPQDQALHVDLHDLMAIAAILLARARADKMTWPAQAEGTFQLSSAAARVHRPNAGPAALLGEEDCTRAKLLWKLTWVKTQRWDLTRM